jgi:diguanylate cyclase
MSLDEAISRLETVIAEVRQASLVDEKTALGSALALRNEERLINEGTSDFNVIVFGDLNDFKQLNDEHTHDAGDVGIKRVGEIINKMIIEDLEAKAFRQGGDEFVILLKEDSVERFLSVSSTLGNVLFSHKDQELRTAMSLGYAFNDGKTSFSDLLARAEAACQIAKVQGDGVCVKWTNEIKLNPLIRLSERCHNCGARTTCNIAQRNAPPKLKCCPSCGEEL